MDLVTTGIASVIFAVLIYFAGVQRGKREKEQDKRERRTNKVADEYIRMANAWPPIDSGISGLIKAGIHTLHDDSEIREAIALIEARVKSHPLGRYKDMLTNIDMKKVFNILLSGNTESFDFEQIINKAKQE